MNSSPLPLSPGLWTSWSPSWSSSQMAQPSPSLANNTLRAPHGMGGLFDTGLAGNAKLGALPALSPELSSTDITTIDPADLFETYLVGDNNDNVDINTDASVNVNKASLLSTNSVDLPQEGNCGEVDLLSSITNIKCENDRLMTAVEAEGDDCVFYPDDSAVTGFGADDSLLGAIGNSDFLEQFTDLSNYSNDGMNNNQMAFDPEQFMKDMAAIEDQLAAPASDALEVTDAVKRSASEAFLEEDGAGEEAMEMEEPLVNPDHNDYTRKSAPVRPLKRARTATVTSESDAESVISSTSSAFGVVPTLGKDQKYLERRRKNNIASRRSRETRKQKFASMDKQADDLERRNAELRVKVAELETLTKLMKDALIQQLAAAGKATA